MFKRKLKALFGRKGASSNDGLGEEVAAPPEYTSSPEGGEGGEYADPPTYHSEEDGYYDEEDEEYDEDDEYHDPAEDSRAAHHDQHVPNSLDHAETQSQTSSQAAQGGRASRATSPARSVASTSSSRPPLHSGTPLAQRHRESTSHGARHSDENSEDDDADAPSTPAAPAAPALPESTSTDAVTDALQSRLAARRNHRRKRRSGGGDAPPPQEQPPPPATAGKGKGKGKENGRGKANKETSQPSSSKDKHGSSSTTHKKERKEDAPKPGSRRKRHHQAKQSKGGKSGQEPESDSGSPARPPKDAPAPPGSSTKKRKHQRRTKTGGSSSSSGSRKKKKNQQGSRGGGGGKKSKAKKESSSSSSASTSSTSSSSSDSSSSDSSSSNSSSSSSSSTSSSSSSSSSSSDSGARYPRRSVSRSPMRGLEDILGAPPGPFTPLPAERDPPIARLSADEGPSPTPGTPHHASPSGSLLGAPSAVSSTPARRGHGRSMSLAVPSFPPANSLGANTTTFDDKDDNSSNGSHHEHGEQHRSDGHDSDASNHSHRSRDSRRSTGSIRSDLSHHTINYHGTDDDGALSSSSAIVSTPSASTAASDGSSQNSHDSRTQTYQPYGYGSDIASRPGSDNGSAGRRSSNSPTNHSDNTSQLPMAAQDHVSTIIPSTDGRSEHETHQSAQSAHDGSDDEHQASDGENNPAIVNFQPQDPRDDPYENIVVKDINDPKILQPKPVFPGYNSTSHSAVSTPGLSDGDLGHTGATAGDVTDDQEGDVVEGVEDEDDYPQEMVAESQAGEQAAPADAGAGVGAGGYVWDGTYEALDEPVGAPARYSAPSKPTRSSSVPGMISVSDIQRKKFLGSVEDDPLDSALGALGDEAMLAVARRRARVEAALEAEAEAKANTAMPPPSMSSRRHSTPSPVNPKHAIPARDRDPSPSPRFIRDHVARYSAAGRRPPSESPEPIPAFKALDVDPDVPEPTVPLASVSRESMIGKNGLNNTGVIEAAQTGRAMAPIRPNPPLRKRPEHPDAAHHASGIGQDVLRPTGILPPKGPSAAAVAAGMRARTRPRRSAKQGYSPPRSRGASWDDPNRHFVMTDEEREATRTESGLIDVGALTNAFEEANVAVAQAGYVPFVGGLPFKQAVEQAAEALAKGESPPTSQRRTEVDVVAEAAGAYQAATPVVVAPASAERKGKGKGKGKGRRSMSSSSSSSSDGRSRRRGGGRKSGGRGSRDPRRSGSGANNRRKEDSRDSRNRRAGVPTTSKAAGRPEAANRLAPQTPHSSTNVKSASRRRVRVANAPTIAPSGRAEIATSTATDATVAAANNPDERPEPKISAAVAADDAKPFGRAPARVHSQPDSRPSPKGTPREKTPREGTVERSSDIADTQGAKKGKGGAKDPIAAVAEQETVRGQTKVKISHEYKPMKHHWVPKTLKGELRAGESNTLAPEPTEPLMWKEEEAARAADAAEKEAVLEAAIEAAKDADRKAEQQAKAQAAAAKKAEEAAAAKAKVEADKAKAAAAARAAAAPPRAWDAGLRAELGLPEGEDGSDPDEAELEDWLGLVAGPGSGPKGIDSKPGVTRLASVWSDWTRAHPSVRKVPAAFAGVEPKSRKIKRAKGKPGDLRVKMYGGNVEEPTDAKANNGGVAVDPAPTQGPEEDMMLKLVADAALLAAAGPGAKRALHDAYLQVKRDSQGRVRLRDVTPNSTKPIVYVPVIPGRDYELLPGAVIIMGQATYTLASPEDARATAKAAAKAERDAAKADADTQEGGVEDGSDGADDEGDDGDEDPASAPISFTMAPMFSRPADVVDNSPATAALKASAAVARTAAAANRKPPTGADNEWYEKWSEKQSRTFYQNVKTNKTTWNLPAGGVIVAEAASNLWHKRYSEKQGKVFYINLSTNKSVWALPADGKLVDDDGAAGTKGVAKAAAATATTAAAKPAGTMGSGAAKPAATTTAATTTTAAATNAASETADSNKYWKRWSEGQKKHFYVNIVTKASAWTLPLNGVIVPDSVRAGAATTTAAGAATTGTATGGKPAVVAPASGEKWTQHWSAGKNRYYYVNTETKKSVWDKPTAAGVTIVDTKGNVVSGGGGIEASGPVGNGKPGGGLTYVAADRPTAKGKALAPATVDAQAEAAVAAALAVGEEAPVTKQKYHSSDESSSDSDDSSAAGSVDAEGGISLFANTAPVTPAQEAERRAGRAPNRIAGLLERAAVAYEVEAAEAEILGAEIEEARQKALAEAAKVAAEERKKELEARQHYNWPSKLEEKAGPPEPFESKPGYVERIVKSADAAERIVLANVYRFFMTTDELLSECIRVFRSCDDNFRAEDPGFHARYHTLLFVETWLSTHYQDFSESPEVLRKLITWLDQARDEPFTKLADALLDQIKAYNDEKAASRRAIDTIFNFDELEGERAEKDERKYTLATAPVDLLCAQIGLLGSRMYAGVVAQDLYDLITSGKTAKRSGLRYLSDFLSNLTEWMASEILQKGTPENRASVMQRLLRLAKEGRRTGNLIVMFAVYNTLCKTDEIKRLTRTFQVLKVTPMGRDLGALVSLCDGKDGYRAIRDWLNSRSEYEPVVPVVDVWLPEMKALVERVSGTAWDSKVQGSAARDLSQQIYGLLHYQRVPWPFMAHKTLLKTLQHISGYITRRSLRVMQSKRMEPDVGGYVPMTGMATARMQGTYASKGAGAVRTDGRGPTIGEADEAEQGGVGVGEGGL